MLGKMLLLVHKPVGSLPRGIRLPIFVRHISGTNLARVCAVRRDGVRRDGVGGQEMPVHILLVIFVCVCVLEQPERVCLSRGVVLAARN